MRKFLLLLTWLLIGVTVTLIWVTKDKTTQKKQLDQVTGEAQIGGDFTLTDQTGKTVHAADFRGRVLLVFFGFTHCPDICPVTVASLSKAMGLLGNDADQAAALFITVDPQRDTPDVLKSYLANFDKHILGLTGAPAQIKQVTEQYKVYYSSHAPEKAAPAHMHMAMEDEPKQDYGVDHSGYIYLMGKDGRFIRVYPYNAPPEEIAQAVRHQLR